MAQTQAQPPRAKPPSGFNITELIDLALCSPEVGAVNFNILRMVLRNMVAKLGIDKEPASVNDVEANQVQKFKNYVDGSAGGGTTPMPGVLKIGPGSTAPSSGNGAPAGGNGSGGSGGPPNVPGPTQQPPATSSPPPKPQPPATSSPPPKPQPPATSSPPPKPSSKPPQGATAAAAVAQPSQELDLPEKVARLEKHVEALYQLPTNSELIEKAKSGQGGAGAAMSLNDTWQIIQLNNRIAAAEAAIQKMASLIEDLAKNMGKVKTDTKTFKKEAEDIQNRKSDLQIQGKDLSEKFDKYTKIVGNLQKDVEGIKKVWKEDRDNIEKALGTNLGQQPSFMKERQGQPAENSRQQQKSPGRDEKGAGGGGGASKPTAQGKGPQSADPKSTAQEKKGAGTGAPKPNAQGKGNAPSGNPKSDTAEGESEADAPETTDPSGDYVSDTQTPVSTKGEDKGKSVAAGGGKQSQKPKPAGQPQQKKPVEKTVAPEQIAEMTPSEIAEQITPEEVQTMTPETFNALTPEQKKVVNDVRKGGKTEAQKKPPMGVKNMAKEQVNAIPPEKIAENMGYEEAANLPPEVVENMDEEQRQALQKVIDKGPPSQKAQVSQQQKGKADVGQIKGKPKQQVQNISPGEITTEMGYEDATALSPEVMAKMTPAQKQAVEKVVKAGPNDSRPGSKKQAPSQKQTLKKPSVGVARMDADQLQQLPPEAIASEMSFKEAAAIPAAVLENMTPEQQQAVKQVLAGGPQAQSSPSGGQDKLSDEQMMELAMLSPEELAAAMTQEQAANLPLEELEQIFSHAQIEEIMRIRDGRARVKGARKASQVDTDSSYDQEMDDDRRHAGVGTGKGGRRKSGKDKSKGHSSKRREQEGKDYNYQDIQDDLEDMEGHSPVDIVDGPLPRQGDRLPPMTLEGYLASLPPEEAANLAADAVQRELQKQYQHLQGMQRQLANDIQHKMEFIYQKLLREIAANQMTTSPYMAIGGPEECLGPGICTGHGMPAGIAVCQFPEVKTKAGGATEPDEKVCPGSGVCPCCKGKGADALGALKGPSDRKSDTPHDPRESTGPRSGVDDALLQEMKSLVMLDLEKIRDEMRSQQAEPFDEQDILERLNAVWEALKILKYNEEALAVKIARQDAFFKKIPMKTIEKLNNIPVDTLESLGSGGGTFKTHRHDTGDHSKHSSHKSGEGKGHHHQIQLAGATGSDKEDIQTLFNNLANVITECGELKEQIDELGDNAKVLESGMVNKQMLVDALGDKADKGLINTKVSYDEFGNTVDELHSQLHSLMVEGYQRNENWKKVTADLAEELAEKLDKVELTPIRTFFKTHLKAVEDKVKDLVKQMEEPDSAGTRKKLLRDYNCLSCDRMINISGITNGPTLPVIGPIPAGHTRASKVALDLHRLRMLKKLDAEAKNCNALEKQGRGIQARANKKGAGGYGGNDTDIMGVVNRYQGGSHTNITNADVLAAQRRKSSNMSVAPAAEKRASVVSNKPPEETAVEVSEAPAPAPEAEPEPAPIPMPVSASPSYEYMMEG